MQSYSEDAAGTRFDPAHWAVLCSMECKKKKKCCKKYKKKGKTHCKSCPKL